MDLKIILLKLTIALVCGAAIGFEREVRDKAAGLRTHILVCVGACLFGIMGMELIAMRDGVDILRLAQGLLIGIGFLGAGVIFRDGDSIRGLTTAAGIWVMGAVGLAAGVGLYRLALIGTAFVLLVMALFSKIENAIKK